MSDVRSGFTVAERAALVEGSRAIGRSGLVVGSAGNLSVRSGDRVLITPRGAELGAVDPKTSLTSQWPTAPSPVTTRPSSRPSSETPLHCAIYQACEARAIVHTHAHYATVLGTLIDELPAIHYVITAFGGPVRVARYETFGTDELAASVTEALEGRSAALMANHGAVVTGRDIEHAVTNALQLEWLASVYYHALCAGTPRTLTTEQLDEVIGQIKALQYGHGGAES